MSEKKNSLEEKRILQKKLQWYTLEAEDGEFNATEVEAMLERLDELESLPVKLRKVKSGAIYPILKKYKTEKWNVRGIF